jgi:hypothetical protein
MTRVAIITPTRNRLESFRLLEQWYLRQTIHQTSHEVDWLVAWDGDGECPCTLNQTLFRLDPTQWGNRSIQQNIMRLMHEALHANYDKIVVMEDDDWYHPTYLQRQVDALDRAEIVGFGPTYNYNLRYRKLEIRGSPKGTCFGKTGFVPRTAEMLFHNIAQKVAIFDIRTWNTYGTLRWLQENVADEGPYPLMVFSPKLMPGDINATAGGRHAKGNGLGEPDYELEAFRHLIGPDFSYYEEYLPPLPRVVQRRKQSRKPRLIRRGN